MFYNITKCFSAYATMPVVFITRLNISTENQFCFTDKMLRGFFVVFIIPLIIVKIL